MYPFTSWKYKLLHCNKIQHKQKKNHFYSIYLHWTCKQSSFTLKKKKSNFISHTVMFCRFWCASLFARIIIINIGLEQFQKNENGKRKNMKEVKFISFIWKLCYHNRQIVSTPLHYTKFPISCWFFFPLQLLVCELLQIESTINGIHGKKRILFFMFLFVVGIGCWKFLWKMNTNKNYVNNDLATVSLPNFNIYYLKRMSDPFSPSHIMCLIHFCITFFPSSVFNLSLRLAICYEFISYFALVFCFL